MAWVIDAMLTCRRHVSSSQINAEQTLHVLTGGRLLSGLQATEAGAAAERKE
jgi:hypothetical protein